MLQPSGLKNNITKIEHKKVFFVPSKISENISLPINIFLKYFMTPTKTLPPFSPTYLITVPKSFNCSNSLSYGLIPSLCIHCHINLGKASQIEIFTKQTTRTNTTILSVFLLILILNQSYHKASMAD